MDSIDKWVESVQSFLMFGIGEDDWSDENVTFDLENHTDFEEIASIKQSVDDFIQKSKYFNESNANVQSRLIELIAKLDAEKHVIASDTVIEKVEKYIKLKLKIQHMCLIRAMYHLRQFRTAKDIPSLIFAVKDDVPGVLLGHSRIKTVVIETVNIVKDPLLAQFHRLLEEHLVAAHNESLIDGDETASNETANKWTAFLLEARDSLLAFTMVNMLPTVLTETSGMILEKFQDSLDVALTPTWGRFHYHLQVARTAKSSQQIMWTFDYTRSFVRMICDLSQALTSSGDLQRLCDLDYASAGRKQVLDKVCKFMRAHLAQIVVDFSPMSRELCMQLAEETLDLDEWLYSIAQSQASVSKSKSRSSAFTPPLTICEVLFDAKDMFHQWLHLEHRYFYFDLRGKCKDSVKAFSFEFDDALHGRGVVVGGAGGGEGEGLHMTRLRCYKGVYDCMSLFFAACERYERLPSGAQRVLSVCVLEPLLCTALGLLLYRTRSSSVLYKISMGTYRPTAAATALEPATAAGGTAQLPMNLVEFIDSALYFQSCLEASAKRKIVSHSALQFRSLLWSELQSWMPQILISEEDARKGFSTADLVDKAWKLPAECLSSTDYSYRNPTRFSTGATGSNINKGSSNNYRGSGSGSALNKEEKEVCEIGECVDVARGLAITLCNVLRQQLKQDSNPSRSVVDTVVSGLAAGDTLGVGMPFTLLQEAAIF